jgi:hypothetical protein
MPVVVKLRSGPLLELFMTGIILYKGINRHSPISKHNLFRTAAAPKKINPPPDNLIQTYWQGLLIFRRPFFFPPKSDGRRLF